MDANPWKTEIEELIKEAAALGIHLSWEDITMMDGEPWYRGKQFLFEWYSDQVTV